MTLPPPLVPPGSALTPPTLVVPTLTKPTGDPERVALWENVRDAIFALPTYFASKLTIQEILATDLHTFNGSLGATIEAQLTDALDVLRHVWDPDRKYSLYRFERQSQQFPDVVLRTTSPGLDPTPLLGIELKGWYVLAKERVPSARFSVTPAVCSPFDLLVIVPWALDAVISGSPKLFPPYVVNAADAARYRNYWWEYVRTNAGTDPTITLSTVGHFYPKKSDPIADVPAYDGGDNFGRYARTDAMDAYIAELFTEELSGIPLDAWQRFLKKYS